MFKNFMKNRKGQNTAEYALLIALVVAGIIAMQQYAQRALQARVRDASLYMAKMREGTAGMKHTAQYEPYYQQSNYTVTRNAAENKRLAEGLVQQDSDTRRVREGNQETTYSATSETLETTSMPSGI